MLSTSFAKADAFEEAASVGTTRIASLGRRSQGMTGRDGGGDARSSRSTVFMVASLRASSRAVDARSRTTEKGDASSPSRSARVSASARPDEPASDARRRTSASFRESSSPCVDSTPAPERDQAKKRARAAFGVASCFPQIGTQDRPGGSVGGHDSATALAEASVARPLPTRSDRLACSQAWPHRAQESLEVCTEVVFVVEVLGKRIGAEGEARHQFVERCCQGDSGLRRERFERQRRCPRSQLDVAIGVKARPVELLFGGDDVPLGYDEHRRHHQGRDPQSSRIRFRSTCTRRRGR